MVDTEIDSEPLSEIKDKKFSTQVSGLEPISTNSGTRRQQSAHENSDQNQQKTSHRSPQASSRQSKQSTYEKAKEKR